MINISDTSNAQSRAGTASKNVSGNGLYRLRSGTLSWTTAKDVVVIKKFTINSINAKLQNNNKQILKSYNLKNICITIFTNKSLEFLLWNPNFII